MGRIIPYIMENNICSKPPTRLCIDIWWEVMSDDVRSFLHDLHSLTLHAQSEFTGTDVAKMTRASRTTKPQKGKLWSTIRNLTVFINHQLSLQISSTISYHRPKMYFCNSQTLTFEPYPGSFPYNEHLCLWLKNLLVV